MLWCNVDLSREPHCFRPGDLIRFDPPPNVVDGQRSGLCPGAFYLVTRIVPGRDLIPGACNYLIGPDGLKMIMGFVTHSVRGWFHLTQRFEDAI